VWKNLNKIVNKIWWSFNLQEREKIIDKHFSDYREKPSSFITGNGFIHCKIYNRYKTLSDSFL